MMAAATTSANIDYHLGILKEKAALRKIREISIKALQDIEKCDADPGGIIQGAEEALAGLRQSLAFPRKNLTEEIREWAMTTDGNFLTTDVYRDLNLTTRDNKKTGASVLSAFLLVTH